MVVVAGCRLSGLGDRCRRRRRAEVVAPYDNYRHRRPLVHSFGHRPLIRHGLRPCHLLPTLRHPVPRPVGPWQPGRCLALPSLYPPPAALRAQPPAGEGESAYCCRVTSGAEPRPYGGLLCPGAVYPGLAVKTPCWRHTQVPPYGEGASFLRRAGPMCPALPGGGFDKRRVVCGRLAFCSQGEDVPLHNPPCASKPVQKNPFSAKKSAPEIRGASFVM